MSLLSNKTIEKNQVELEIGISRASFDETVSKIFKTKAASITVPGFRKGKAPRSIIEKMYGKGMFFEDALNELLPEAVDSAAKEAKIEAVSRPDIDIKSMDEGQDVVVTAKFFVKPEVTVKDYKGIKATKIIAPVTEADITAEIDKARQRNARSIEVTDRAAKNGDEVTFDFEGFVDGVAFEGGKAEKHKLKLGSGQFIPGFEAQIEGKSIGEEFDVNVTFPEEYQEKTLAGKAAVFKCKLHEITFEELPELDDEFAKDVSDFDTLAAYRDDIKAKIESRNDKAAQNSVEGMLIDGLLAGFEADIPDVMFETELSHQMSDYENNLRMQGLDMKMFMQYTGQTLESMKEQMMPSAQRQVKTRLALEKIAALENITYSEEDLEKEYETIAKAYEMEIDVVRERVDAEILKHDISVRKAVEFIKENAVITEEIKKLEDIKA